MKTGIEQVDGRKEGFYDSRKDEQRGTCTKV